MKILHYSLGFPPYRSGGLTKFCVDLMNWQAHEGNEVSLLWPGKMTLTNSDRTRIIRRQPEGKVNSYEVVNPNPVPYDEGIVQVKRFVQTGSLDIYRSFLKKVNPDIIHFHTLMGLHKELIEAAKELKIRLVFTTHDFYPMCPRVTLFHNNSICKDATDCKLCPECNAHALSINKIRILQSPTYRRLKNVPVIQKLRKNHRDNVLNGNNSKKPVNNKSNPSDYQSLREYYYSMIRMMDCIHFNSDITKKIYCDFFKGNLPESTVISITHGMINNNMKIRHYGEKIRITYLGAQSTAKGYFELRKALDELLSENKNFVLNEIFEPVNNASYINVIGKYTSEQLGDVFDKTDVLIVPSLWYETFGYTVIEALSFGVPVIVSNRVGAMDIIPDGAGIVYDAENHNELVSILRGLNRDTLEKMNRVIVSDYQPLSIAKMNSEIFIHCYL